MRIKQLMTINHRIGIRTQLVTAYSLLISVLLLVFGFRYYDVSRTIVSDLAEKNMYDVVKKNNQIIDTKLSQAKDNILSFLVDKDLYTAFASIKPTDDYQIALLDKKIAVEMDKYFAHLGDIYSAQLATSYATFRPTASVNSGSGKNFIPEGVIKKTSMYRQAVAQEGRIVWIPTYNFSEMFDVPYMTDANIEFRYMFSGAVLVNGTYFDGSTYATFSPDIEKPVLLVNYKEDFFRNVFQSSLPVEGSYFFVVTKDGQYVSHRDSSKIGKNDHYEWMQSIIDRGSGTAKVDINGQETIVSFDTSSVTGWVSVVVIPSGHLLSDMLTTMKSYLVYSLLLLIAILIFTSYFVTGRITKPLLHLLKAFKQTGEGNFDITVDEQGSKELVVLSRRFKEMNEKIQKLIEENYLIHIKEKEAEITALNLQLDPHFMYNTLNVINLISVENGQDEISEMIVSLSNMLKYTVKTASDRVPFKSDWEYLQSYILIMTKRFEGRFEVETDIDSVLFNYGVPKFFLQPFVENAFVHAFEQRRSGGKLTITGRMEEGGRVFVVADNGSGFPDDVLARIRSGDGSSVGIHNVSKRISIMYGEPYGVEIESVPGQGTTVTVRLPEE